MLETNRYSVMSEKVLVGTILCSDDLTENEVSPTNSDCTSNNQPKQKLLCVICQDNVSRYKCPGCLAVTCSCACFKSHKELTGCNGHRDPVPVALGNETPEEMLMRDCRFLEDVLSKIDRSYRDTKFHHIVPRKQGRGVKRSANQQEEENPLPARMLYGKHKPSSELKSRFQHLIPEYPYQHWGQDGWQACRFDLSRPLKKLRYEARARQTIVSFLPRGMSRHVDNTSHFDEKCRSIRWRVRLVFVHADAYVEHTVHEDTRLGQVVAKVLDTPFDQLRVWSCTDSNLDGPSKACGVDHSQDTDPLEDGWSERRSSDERPEVRENVDGSLENRDLNTRSETPLGLSKAPAVLTNDKDQQSSKISLSNDASKLIKVAKDTENVSESKTVVEGKIGVTVVNNNSNAGRKSHQLLPFQELLSLEPDDVYTSTLNPFIQQANQYTPCPSKSLVKDLTPDPIADSSHAPSPSEADQFMYYKAAGLGQLAVVFRHEKGSDFSRYTLMDLTDTLKDNLAGLNVIEYPILLVMRKHHVYEFLNRADVPHGNDIRNFPIKREEVHKHQDRESNGLKYFDADCSLDDEQ